MIPGTDKLTRSFTLFVGLFPHVQACQLRLKKQGKDPLAATSKAAVEADVSTEKITITGDMFGINDENLARALADQVLDVTLATVNPI